MSGSLVLAIDTTTEHGSLALARDGVVIGEVLLESPDGYGHVLFEAIEALLAREGVALADIDLFAAAHGPGTFTGIRVGLAAAKGFAAALGKSAAGVSNLHAVALLGSGERRAAVLDARRGEVYVALFDGDANPLTPETVAPFDTWLDNLTEGPISFLFTNASPFGPALDSSRFANAPRISVGYSMAGAIARLAPQHAKDPALLDANYVRKSDAEMAWTER